MSIAKYCKEKGFSRDEFYNFKSNIEALALAIRSQLTYKGGMYYPTTELFKYNTIEDYKPLIINQLKELGIEFRDYDREYRVTD
jgi:hypothetical protein